MKRLILLNCLILLIVINACAKEDVITDPKEAITGQIVDIDSIESEEEVEESDDIIEEISTLRFCYDSDKGIVKWVNGSVFGFYDNAKRFEFNDFCFDNNVLIEYYCDDDEIPQNITFLCKNGCLDNHCT
jgi:hypothetical protein